MQHNLIFVNQIKSNHYFKNVILPKNFSKRYTGVIYMLIKSSARNSTYCRYRFGYKKKLLNLNFVLFIGFCKALNSWCICSNIKWNWKHWLYGKYYEIQGPLSFCSMQQSSGSRSTVSKAFWSLYPDLQNQQRVNPLYLCRSGLAHKCEFQSVNNILKLGYIDQNALDEKLWCHRHIATILACSFDVKDT